VRNCICFVFFLFPDRKTTMPYIAEECLATSIKLQLSITCSIGMEMSRPISFRCCCLLPVCLESRCCIDSSQSQLGKPRHVVRGHGMGVDFEEPGNHLVTRQQRQHSSKYINSRDKDTKFLNVRRKKRLCLYFVNSALEISF